MLPSSRPAVCQPACPTLPVRNINYRASSVAHVSRVTRVDTANTNGAGRTRMTIIVFRPNDDPNYLSRDGETLLVLGILQHYPVPSTSM